MGTSPSCIIPSCEAILLEIQQSFGLNDLQTVEKRRFANMENGVSKHLDLGQRVVGRLVDSLWFAHDPQLLDDLMLSAMEILQFHSAVESRTRTFGADARQIAWHLLAYQIMPGLGRKYAFWSLAAPVAPGMPHGDLWFLPRAESSDPARLRLPVQTMADWWLDLLDCPMEAIWTDEDGASRVRTLQNWRAGMLPKPDAIDGYFRSGHKFRYLGTFQDRPEVPLETRFRDALEFVKDRKRMDAVTLSREIPSVPPTVFEAALSEAADGNAKHAFVRAVAERWQAPVNDTVRRRFLLARAFQDGYTRLVKLINPEVQAHCPDPARNKVLQLLNLSAEAYRLTVEADRGCRSEADSNRRFAAIVPGWLAQGPFKSIMTVQGQESEQLSRFLSDRFREIENGGGINDLFMGGDLSAGLAARTMDSAALTARREMEELLERLRSAVDAGVQVQAEDLLRQIADHPRRDEYEADILFCEGRHRLSGNDAEGARTRFNAAFDACKRRGYGSLRKDIAYACLGTAVAFDHFSERTEQYFRAISTVLDPSETAGCHPLELEQRQSLDILFRNAAVRASELFWNSLYRPYPGVEPFIRPAQEQYKELLGGFLALMMSDDEAGMRRWAAHNRKQLDTRLRDVRGDTFFGGMLKMVNTLEKNFRASVLPPDEGNKIGSIIVSWRTGLHRLAGEMSRKALDATDFKRQTALMLAADSGDAKLVSILLDRGVDFDAQDYLGRTALHAAAASRSAECFLLILGKGADPSKRTVDDLAASALHTAVKFGVVGAVDATLEKWTARFAHDELAELLEMARDIYANYKRRRTEMAQRSRAVGPKPAYKAIAGKLERSIPVGAS